MNVLLVICILFSSLAPASDIPDNCVGKQLFVINEQTTSVEYYGKTPVLLKNNDAKRTTFIYGVYENTSENEDGTKISYFRKVSGKNIKMEAAKYFVSKHEGTWTAQWVP